MVEQRMKNPCSAGKPWSGAMVGWLLLIFFSRSVTAQDFNIAKLKLFQDRDQVLIKDVTTDSFGFVWFLTNGEIYRFDGYRSLDVSKTISNQYLTEDMPQRILMDTENRLWMAGNATLSYLDLATWKVHTIDSTLLPPLQDRSVFWFKNVTETAQMIAYENGGLLLIENGKVSRVALASNSESRSANKVKPRSVTWWDGKYWVGTTVGTLYSIDPAQRNNVTYHTLNGIDDVILSIIPQGEALVLNVYNRGLFRYKPGEGLAKHPVGEFNVSSEKFSILQQGKSFHVYADEESAWILNPNLQPLQRLKIPSVHRFRTASVHLTDEEILLGNEEGVFVIYPKLKGLSHLIPANSGVNKSTRGIYVYPDGSIFYGSYGGAGFLSADGSTQLLPQIKHAYAVLPINESELLIGTEGGFLKVFNRKSGVISNYTYTLSPEAKRLSAYNLPDYVLSLSETRDFILVGSQNGLWTLDKKTRELARWETDSDDAQLSDLHIRHIQVLSDDRMELSTNLGLFRLDGHQLTKLYPASGNLGVYKSINRNDTLWLATQGKGVVSIDLSGKVLGAVTTTQDLSNNIVYSLEHVDGTWVAGTADGLNLIRGKQVRRISVAEGLLQSEFNSGATFWDEKRRLLYLGGLNGYTILDMNQPWFEGRDRLHSYVTEVHTSFGYAGGKSTDFTWPYRGERTLVLQPGQSLTALYVGTPRRYRAEGRISYALNAGEWEKLGEGQFISLIEPSPGEYRIRLETHSTGIGGSEKEMIVVKRPRFYETWWFTTLVLAITLGLLVFLYRRRLRKVRREHAIRNRIAADLHDEVGSSLTRIYFQANSLSSQELSGEKYNRQLKTIAETSQQALATMSDMVWSIDPRFDSMRELLGRMKDYAYKLRDELHFEYQFEVKGNVETEPVSQVVRQNLFMIYKEALINAIKYGDGSEIRILFCFDGGIRLVVTNSYSDSSSAKTDWKQGGRGLENMKLRAAKVGAELTTTTQNGAYCVVFELSPKRGI
jgi:signal transduction histidine kinase/outer membrane lipoprotein-sorting protein